MKSKKTIKHSIIFKNFVLNLNDWQPHIYFSKIKNKKNWLPILADADHRGSILIPSAWVPKAGSSKLGVEWWTKEKLSRDASRDASLSARYSRDKQGNARYSCSKQGCIDHSWGEHKTYK